MDIGSSFYPSELVGAFLYAQFEQADKINVSRCKTFMRYYKELESLEKKGFFRRPFFDDKSTCNGHIFYIITRSPIERDNLIQYLENCGINSLFHYVPLHSSPAGKKFGKFSGKLINTEQISQKLLRLPLYYGMTDDDIDIVIESICNFYR